LFWLGFAALGGGETSGGGLAGACVAGGHFVIACAAFGVVGALFEGGEERATEPEAHDDDADDDLDETVVA
jgi:hypothetical protein